VPFCADESGMKPTSHYGLSLYSLPIRPLHNHAALAAPRQLLLPLSSSRCHHLVRFHPPQAAPAPLSRSCGPQPLLRPSAARAALNRSCGPQPLQHAHAPAGFLVLLFKRRPLGHQLPHAKAQSRKGRRSPAFAALRLCVRLPASYNGGTSPGCGGSDGAAIRDHAG